MYEQLTIDSSVIITNGLMADGTKSERHGQNVGDVQRVISSL
jgi:hypothetical protein